MLMTAEPTFTVGVVMVVHLSGEKEVERYRLTFCAKHGDDLENSFTFLFVGYSPW